MHLTSSSGVCNCPSAVKGGKTDSFIEEFRSQAPEMALGARNNTFHQLYTICRLIRILTDCFNLSKINLDLNCFMLELQREPPKCKTGVINSLQGVWSDITVVLGRQGNSKQI